jgi:hypothetical protein
MSLSAFDVGGATAHPALCGQFATEAPAPDIAPDFSDVCEDAPAPPATAVGAEAQRADFSACEEVLAAIRQGRMTFSWSPVRNARAPDELLYLAATAWVTTLVYDDRRTARDCIMLAVVVQRHFAARGFA